MTGEHSAPLEVRVSGRTLTGEAMVYGQRARDRAEMFEPASLEPVHPVELNLQHDRARLIATTGDGGLRLDTDDKRVAISAELREGSAELALVRRRKLTGLSVEFHVHAERREASGLRVIERAALVGVGLVDVGSYRTGVELRALGGWLRAEIPIGRRASCECAGPDCDSVLFDMGSLDELIDGPGDVIATSGRLVPENILGSREAGTLAFERTAAGVGMALLVGSTPAAASVRAAAAVAPIHARPLVDVAASESTVDDGMRTYTRAHVTTILVKTAPPGRRDGWDPAEVDGADPAARSLNLSRRLPRWL